VKHDQIWFESRLAREFAKLKPQTPKPVLVQTTVPVIETCGDAVYLQFLHLNLILILDRRFYTSTLRGLLNDLTALAQLTPCELPEPTGPRHRFITKADLLAFYDAFEDWDTCELVLRMDVDRSYAVDVCKFKSASSGSQWAM
jgi:hypothetical protein